MKIKAGNLVNTLDLAGSADSGTQAKSLRMTGTDLRELARVAGADDVGLVEIDRPALAGQREDLRKYFPFGRTLVAFVCKLNREPIRSTARSLANIEFHETGHDISEVSRRIVRALEDRGIRAASAPVGFPMEADLWPGKMWTISHKPVAVEAGLGNVGIHRLVIHPQFGNFVMLGTVVVGAEVESYDQPLSFNPCFECRLCVSACPVGAIGADGHFDFSACYTHNYREFMGGFNDWVETVADSGSRKNYRQRVSAAETTSMWQSLSFGANYKAAYCMSVCPAGEDVIGVYNESKATHLREVVKPLQKKEEPAYVVPGSDAEAHVIKGFPHKEVRRVRGSLLPVSVAGFLAGMNYTFQRHQADGLDAVYHFTFTGREKALATVVIRDRKLHVAKGHVGEATLRVTADTETWLGFLAREKNLAVAILTGKIRMRGNPKWLVAFGKCFPS